MKVLAVLLCALVAVQGRSAVVENSNALTAQGENPWLVHLRIAVSTSGLLNSGVGSLISNRWVLSSSDAVINQRFIWIRFGVVNVIQPSLVIETSTARTSGNAALISINRVVASTASIAPIGLSSSFEAAEFVKFCGFGELEDGAAGETLRCFEAFVNEEDNSLAFAGEVSVSGFDSGAPLVSDGKQVGLVVGGRLEPIAGYLDWIEAQTGVRSRAASEDRSLRQLN